MNNVAAIILAAGRGTRMNSTTTNKVMSEIHGKPLLFYTVERIRNAGINTIIVVVGFAKESILHYFGDSLLYAEQKEQNGTAHAAAAGLGLLAPDITDVLSVYGDDSYLYDPELLKKLINEHQREQADVTMLTIDIENPTGLGRIVRDELGHVKGIVEDKVATEQQKQITEINTGCYIFKRSFLEEYLPKVHMNPIAQEYYLTDIIELAAQNNKKVAAVRGGHIPWRGVNRPEELVEARKLVH